MKIVRIHLSDTPADPAVYRYRVELHAYSGLWETIHTGKFFADAFETDIELDFDDILVSNRQYSGVQSIVPVISASDNQYEMPADARGILKECYRNEVRVSSLDTPSAFDTVTKEFWFLPTQVFGYGFSMGSGLQVPVIADGIVPHIPSNAPQGFKWSVLVYNNGAGAETVTCRRDGTVTDTFQAAAYTPYHIPLSGADGLYTVNGHEVALVDSCPKPYYLIWLDNMGGLQCQGFLESSEFGRKYSNKTAVDSKNSEWQISSTVTGNWTLKSQNLSELAYRVYGQMFQSPWLALLDMVNGRLHYVNISQTDYTEKRRTRRDTKPVFFQVKVASAEKLRI